MLKHYKKGLALLLAASLIPSALIGIVGFGEEQGIEIIENSEEYKIQDFYEEADGVAADIITEEDYLAEDVYENVEYAVKNEEEIAVEEIEEVDADTVDSTLDLGAYEDIVESEEAPGYFIDIAPGEAKEVSVVSEYESAYLRIIPPKNGIYMFYSEDEEDDDIDTVGGLYLFDNASGTMTLLEKNDDGGDGGNFKIQYSLAQGKTYYLKTSFYDLETGSYIVYMKERSLSVLTASNNEIEIDASNAHEGVNLLVEATTTLDTNISYTWYEYNLDMDEYIELTNVNTEKYFISAPKTKQYMCEVTDGSGITETVYFSVQVNNKLNVVYQDNIYVAEGNAAVCEVFASPEYGECSYSWYKLSYEYQEDEDYEDYYYQKVYFDETSSKLVLQDYSEYDEICCRVEDEYNNYYVCWFYILICEDHDWCYEQMIENATCINTGIQLEYCTKCKIERNVTIPVTGHTEVLDKAVAATCTTSGFTAGKHCSACGEILVAQEVVKATGHTLGAWKMVSKATVHSAAQHERKCTVCGYSEKKVVGQKLKPTMTLNVSDIVLKTKQSTNALKVTGLAAGDSVKSYKSSNKKIFTVNSSGKITAKNKTGSAKLTITLKSGLSKTITVKVQKAAVTTQKISGVEKKLTLKKNKSYTLKPILKPITSTQKITFSTSNKKVVTVNNKGVITAKKKGTAKITVKSGTKKVVCTVKVK